MTLQGVATVARHEFKLRIRAGRWRWLLGAWFVVVSAFTVLVHLAVRAAYADADGKGVVVFGWLVLFVLGLALLVVPSLTAQSVNGDRERGTLATLQVTRLSALEIALGKLAAAWGTSLVFLALTFPAVVYSALLGGVQFDRVLVVWAVVALLLGVVAAVALALSSLLNRSSTSGVLSYLAVFALTVGTLVAFGIASALSSETYTQTDNVPCPTASDLQPKGLPPADVQQMIADCNSAQLDSGTRTRSDHVWWVIAPNPFVIVADAAPHLPLFLSGDSQDDVRNADPLGGIGRAVRDIRKPPGSPDYTGKLVWPYGLAFDVLIGAGAVWLTARRLKTPSKRLARGQRVA